MVGPDLCASVLTCPGGRSTATPPTRSRRLRNEPRPFAAFSAAASPPVDCTITCTVFVGDLSAFARRPGATYVVCAAAAVETGTSSASAPTVAATIVLPREPPLGPLPQRVLARAP